MIEWVKCTPEHIDAIPLDPNAPETLDAIKADLEFAATLLEDGMPIACAGVQRLYDGVGEAWSVWTPETIERRGIAIARYARGYLDRLQKEEGFRRIQAICVPSIAFVEWLEAIGFEREGLLRNAMPGGDGDVWMCGRVVS